VIGYGILGVNPDWKECPMTITVELPEDTERQLRERAARTGRDVPTLVRELIERSMKAEPTIDEILAPFRRQVAESGMTDDELNAFFEEARDEVWRERQGGGR
jgi:plasmid stability protein